MLMLIARVNNLVLMLMFASYVYTRLKRWHSYEMYKAGYIAFKETVVLRRCVSETVVLSTELIR